MPFRPQLRRASTKEELARHEFPSVFLTFNMSFPSEFIAAEDKNYNSNSGYSFEDPIFRSLVTVGHLHHLETFSPITGSRNIHPS
jgi:hypothetical protein